MLLIVLFKIEVTNKIIEQYYNLGKVGYEIKK